MDNGNNELESPAREANNQQQFETPPGQIIRGNPANPPQLRQNDNDNLEPPRVRRRIEGDAAPRNLDPQLLWVQQVAGRSVVTPDGDERRSRARQSVNGSSVITPSASRRGESASQLARRILQEREADTDNEDRAANQQQPEARGR